MTVLSGFSFGASFRCVCHQACGGLRGALPYCPPERKPTVSTFFFVFVVLKTGSHCVFLAGLEFTYVCQVHFELTSHQSVPTGEYL